MPTVINLAALSPDVRISTGWNACRTQRAKATAGKDAVGRGLGKFETGLRRSSRLCPGLLLKLRGAPGQLGQEQALCQPSFAPLSARARQDVLTDLVTPTL